MAAVYLERERESGRERETTTAGFRSIRYEPRMSRAVARPGQRERGYGANPDSNNDELVRFPSGYRLQSLCVAAAAWARRQTGSVSVSLGEAGGRQRLARVCTLAAVPRQGISLSSSRRIGLGVGRSKESERAGEAERVHKRAHTTRERGRDQRERGRGDVADGSARAQWPYRETATAE